MTESSAEPPDRPGLHGSVRILRRRWRMAVLVLLAAVGASLAYSLTSTPIYLASTDVLIEPSGADVQASSGTKVSADEVATQTQVVTSLPVARLVQERDSLDDPPDLDELVSVQAVGTSRILRITAQDTSAAQAAETANTVATAYLQFREQDSVARYEQARERLLSQQTDIENRLRDVNALLADAPGAGASLQAERRSLLTSMAQVSTQIDDLTDSLTTSAAGGQLLRSAQQDGEPISPRTTLNVILGAVVGLVLGVGAALLRDRFDDVVHEEDAVRQALDSVVLARVPQWSDRHVRDRLITLQEPHAPPSEEYQRLAVNVRFMMATGSRSGGSVVLVTAGREREGKTVTASNLAVAAARLGLEVVLVDADFRRATVGVRFGLGDPPGLSDVLIGDDGAADHLLDVGVPHLRVLPAGTLPPNPAALLSSERMREVLAGVSAKADLVIVDSPPVLTGADTLELVGLADMVLVVARERVSRRRQLVSVREALRQVGVGSTGVVYNGTADTSRSSYGYPSRPRDTGQGETDRGETASPPDPETEFHPVLHTVQSVENGDGEAEEETSATGPNGHLDAVPEIVTTYRRRTPSAGASGTATGKDTSVS